MEDIWLKRWNTLKNHIAYEMDTNQEENSSYHTLELLQGVMGEIEEMADDVPGVGNCEAGGS